MLNFNAFSPVFKKLFSQTTRTFVTCSYNQGTKPMLSNNALCENSLASSVKPDSVWSFDIVRTAIRNNFPYPRESKRIKVHGYKKLMSTPKGRAILMRRILKGRHVLSH